MYTFSVQIEFSQQVIDAAVDVAERLGEDTGVAYLEKVVDNALEGAYFVDVVVNLVQ